MRIDWVLSALLLAAPGLAPAAVVGVYSGDGEFLGRLNARTGCCTVQITTTKGYVVDLRQDGADWTVSSNYPSPEQVFFGDVACTRAFGWLSEAGVVVRDYDSATQSYSLLMVRPSAARLPTGSPLYTKQGGQCVQNAEPFDTVNALHTWVEIVPNAPVETGISGGPYTPPLRYQMLYGDWTQGSTFQSSYEPTELLPRND